MNENQKRIEAYLKGEMTADQLASFKEELTSNRQLVEDLKLEEDMFIAYGMEGWFTDNKADYNEDKYDKLTSFFTSAAANKVEKIIEKVIHEKDSKRSFYKAWFFRVAAAVLAFFMLAYLLMPSQKSYQELYSETVALNELPSLISRSENAPSLVKGQQAFKAMKYEDAVLFFSQYLKNSDEPLPYSQIYLGISYLELYRFEEAFNILGQLEASGNLDSADAEWYKTLGYLKKGDTLQVKEALHSIAIRKGPYSEKASQLLREIK